MTAQRTKPPPTDNPSEPKPALSSLPATTAPTLHLNVEDWLPYLDDSEATEAQKREIIETLWSLVLTFLDLGWEFELPDHGDQMASKSTDLPPETVAPSLDLSTALRAAMLNSKDTENHQNNKEEV